MEDFALDDWSVISAFRPKCKPRPNPKPAPKYRFTLDTPRAKWIGHAPQIPAVGLAAPLHSFQPLDSLHGPTFGRGLEAPHRVVRVPMSLQQPEISVESFPVNARAEASHPVGEVGRPAPPLRFPGVPRPQSSGSIVRTKQSSQSTVVQQLWKTVMIPLVQFSTLLQQLQQSSNMQQHIDRLLDTFAASTLVKYLTALGQFFQISADLRVDLSSLTLTEIQLADIL